MASNIPLRVLIVEDSENDAFLLLRELQRGGYEPVHRRVETAEAMREALRGAAWDIILSDYVMPRFSGLAALDLLRGQEIDIPFIIVSGKIGEEVAVESMRAGAHDYILKNNLARLLPAVRRELADAQVRRDRKAMEGALARSERYFRSLIENALDAVVFLDAQGTFLYVSPSFERILGHAASDVLGGTLLEFAHSDDIPKLQELLIRPLGAPGQAKPEEFRLRRKDKQWRTMEAVSSRVMGEDASVNGLVLNLRDVTERLDLEEQLRQSQKLEAIGKLAGGVAHDFNNVLTAILGYSDMLLYQMDVNSPLRDTAGEIRKAGMRGASLTHQLLAFSRKQVLQPAVLDLNAVVSNMQKMLRRLIGENVSLVTVLEPALVPVLADQGQIEQVILNLAVNARDAMPEGGRLVVQTMNFALYPNSAWAQGGFNPGDYALLQITDTGNGMEPETLEHMFEPFYTTKQPGQGTGLGLATVYGIVKQSGGHIWVSSRPGLGTAFKIYLPRTTQQKHDLPPRPSAPAMSTGTETILLVEDEDSVRSMTAAVLRHCGYRVFEAQHGGEAMRISRDFNGGIDLLLTDVVMPGMSGPLLAESLRAQRPHVRVLLTSGYIGQEQPGMDQWMKEDNFLPKPFTAQQLSEKVRLVLDAGKDKLVPQR